jgi:hypothetical protein
MDTQICECTVDGCKCRNPVPIDNSLGESVEGAQCDECKEGVHDIADEDK